MVTTILFIIGIAAVCLFLFKVSRFSSWRPGLRKDQGDGFGNHAEQRFLEEDHGVTMAPSPAAETVGSYGNSSFGAGGGSN